MVRLCGPTDIIIPLLCTNRDCRPFEMAKKRNNVPLEPAAKRRKRYSDEQFLSPEMQDIRKSPSPESGLANWSRGIRGIFSNIGSGDQTDEVINGATPKSSNFFSSATKAFSTLTSQLPRLSEDVGLLTSITRTKLLAGGLVDDKHYEVSLA